MASKETPFTDAQIAEQLGTCRAGRTRIRPFGATYETDGWPITLMLVNALGFIAEAADHHPDLDGDLSPCDGHALDPQRRRDHCEGFRAGPKIRRSGAVEAAARRRADRNARTSLSAAPVVTSSAVTAGCRERYPSLRSRLVPGLLREAFDTAFGCCLCPIDGHRRVSNGMK